MGWLTAWLANVHGISSLSCLLVCCRRINIFMLAKIKSSPYNLKTEHLQVRWPFKVCQHSPYFKLIPLNWQHQFKLSNFTRNWLLLSSIRNSRNILNCTAYTHTSKPMPRLMTPSDKISHPEWFQCWNKCSDQNRWVRLYYF